MIHPIIIEDLKIRDNNIEQNVVELVKNSQRLVKPIESLSKMLTVVFRLFEFEVRSNSTVQY